MRLTREGGGVRLDGGAEVVGEDAVALEEDVAALAGGALADRLADQHGVGGRRVLGGGEKEREGGAEREEGEKEGMVGGGQRWGGDGGGE